jgi:hypothetical protein
MQDFGVEYVGDNARVREELSMRFETHGRKKKIVGRQRGIHTLRSIAITVRFEVLNLWAKDRNVRDLE